jgi:hypothetical protein
MSFIVKRFIELPGEAIEIDRGAGGRFGIGKQPNDRGIVESVTRSLEAAI